MKKKTIGEMTKSRQMWQIKPVTRIVRNKKGKGSYNRQAAKKMLGDFYFSKSVFTRIRKIIRNKI